MAPYNLKVTKSHYKAPKVTKSNAKDSTNTKW
jgi:hypothetical protein